MAGPARLYFEDVEVGTVVETPAVTVTEAHVRLYSGLTQDTADAGTVPELLLLCLTTGLGWRIGRPPLAVMAFLGLEWRVNTPLRVGDTIHSRSRTAVMRAMREGGVIVEEREVFNQHGEVVHQGRFTFLVAKRPS